MKTEAAVTPPPCSQTQRHNSSTGLFDDDGSHLNPQGYDSPHSACLSNYSSGTNESNSSDSEGSESDGIRDAKQSVKEARNVWSAVTGWVGAGSSVSAEVNNMTQSSSRRKKKKKAMI